MAHILVVDDEASVRFTLTEVLTERGHSVDAASSGEEARTLLGGAHVVITDLSMPGMDGLALLKEARSTDPGLPVIVLTARGSERSAVEAMKAGAHDYLTKPFDIDELGLAVERAAELDELRRRERRSAVERSLGMPLVGDSKPFREVVDAALRVADRDVTVLVVGETGTGKELIASLLHARSRRSNAPLVRFNCAAIPDDLAEAELFGHRRGAFTGATSDHQGHFARADGGTLVLDEVGELSRPLQPKLLRALQEGEFHPIGADDAQRVDVRIVGCTNRDLESEATSGSFRSDLFYRLAVVQLSVPPLRERRTDIRALAELFRRRYAHRFGLDDVPLPEALLARFESHHWPGNVRELENAIASLLALSPTGRVGPEAWHPKGEPIERTQNARALRQRVRDYERRLLAEALAETGGNQSEAARRLGVTRSTLIDKLKRLGLFRAP